MPAPDSTNGTATAGTAGGILTILFANIPACDLIRTILLAMIGAIVSFGVSMALKMMVDAYRKKHSAGR